MWVTMLGFQLSLSGPSLKARVALNIFLTDFNSISFKTLCSICSFLFDYNLNTEILQLVRISRYSE